MKEKTTVANDASQQSGKKECEQPLIKALIAQAHRRGESLTTMANHLGVSYERFCQWRRTPSSIANANEVVFIKASQYLGVPTILVMVMAGRVELHQFVWPAAATLEERVFRELSQLRKDPFLGGFVPNELSDSPLPVQLFVLFLYNQLGRHGAQEDSGHRWLSTLQQAAAGEVHRRAQSDSAPSVTQGRGEIF